MKLIRSKYSYWALIPVLAIVISAGCGERGGYSLVTPTRASFAVTGKIPAANDIEVDLAKPIVVTFSDEVQAATVNSTNLVVTAGGVPVSGTWVYDASTKSATYTPTSDYPSGSVVTVAVKAGVLKTDSSPLAPTQWTFTTVSLASLNAYWRFDGDGSDNSGNNHTAVNTNVTYDTSIVKQGSASAYFDGSAYFDMGTIDFGDAFTITVWIYLPDPIGASINTVISNGFAGMQEDGFKIFINEWGTSNRSIATEAGDGTNGALLVTSTNFATLGEWKHLAVVINKNAAPSQRALFYFDGRLTTQTIHPDSTLPSFPSVFATNQQTYVGQFPGGSFPFQGHMDDFRIYKRALTPTEILKISQQQ